MCCSSVFSETNLNENWLREGFKKKWGTKKWTDVSLSKPPPHPLFARWTTCYFPGMIFSKLQISPSPAIDWKNLERHYSGMVGLSVCPQNGNKTQTENTENRKFIIPEMSQQLKCHQNWNYLKLNCNQNWNGTKK